MDSPKNVSMNTNETSLLKLLLDVCWSFQGLQNADAISFYANVCIQSFFRSTNIRRVLLQHNSIDFRKSTFNKYCIKSVPIAI